LHLLSIVFVHADILPDGGAERESVCRQCGLRTDCAATARWAEAIP